jgi:hypothetical protein
MNGHKIYFKFIKYNQLVKMKDLGSALAEMDYKMKDF